MSISDKITSIQNHLTDDYTALETLGVSVEDRNIENIKDMANQIYAKFPKTDYEEGSNITLSNTLKGKLDFEDGIVGYGQTSQEGTPTPDSPQDIEVVRGKNLAQLEFENGYRNSGSGEIISTGSFCSFIAEVSPNNEYYASNAHSNLCYLDINKNRIGGIAFSGGGLFNTNNMPNIAYVSVAVENSKKDSIQIEKGFQATSYLPYNTLEVVERGINFLDESTLRQGAWNGVSTIMVSFYSNKYLKAGTYTIVTNLNITNYRYVVTIASNQFPLGSGKSIDVYDSQWQQVAYKTFTINQDGYLGVSVSKSNGTDTITPSDISSYNFMIYEGEYDSSITYEPYQTPQTYQLSLGDKELYEDSTIVRNSDGSWKFVDNCYRLISSVLSGFTIGVADSDGKKFVVTKGNFVGVPAPKPGKIYCTHLRYNLSAWYADGYCGIVSPGANLWMQMTQAIESVDAFKTFITTNNMEIVYQTEQPIETPITDTTLINQLNAWYYSHSFTGTTIIEINGQLPLIIKVRALKGE